MILGGFFAQRGYLDLVWIYLYGFLGTYIGETVFYYMGRTQGASFIERKPKWKAKSKRIFNLLHKHKYVLIIGHRFFYGMRSITPFIIGTSGIKPLQFALLNAAAGLIWTLAWGTAGFFFGHTLEQYIDEFEKYEIWILTGFILFIMTIWFISHYSIRRIGR